MQQIYDTLFKLSLELGYDTYNHLPSSGAKYPFVHIGEQFSDDQANKTSITGKVTQYVRIYGSNDDRMLVTSMANNLVTGIRNIRHTDTFYISVKGLRQQVMTETVTASNPIVGRLEIDFKFN